MASRKGATKTQTAKTAGKMNRDRVLQVHRESQMNIPVAPAVKRPSDSPEMNAAKKRRTAFEDLTNARKNALQAGKKGELKKAAKKVKGDRKKVQVLVAVPKRTTASKPSATSSQPETVGLQDDVSYEVIELSQEVRASQESNSSRSSSPEIDAVVVDENRKNLLVSGTPPSEVSEGGDFVDIDNENMQDPYQVALYAHHIFKYYQIREEHFKLKDFMSRQKDLTANMRAILVDWLVEVQENFELNHETLYLAVKIVDHYLNRVQVTRDRLQLIGATALFISCKFDERCPPVLDDFLYICDDAYQRQEMLDTEKEILKRIGFDIGYPLSYRFLRRYAKCARADMQTLTLGRYILEMSLMDYCYTQEKDSQVAAAALLLAMKMKGCANWDKTLVHYSGYKQEDLVPLLARLNCMISAPPNKQLTTIRSKYSHTVFHEVAKLAPLSDAAVESLTSDS